MKKKLAKCNSKLVLDLALLHLGVSLPFKYKGGETAYDAPANPGRPSKKEKKISPASDKKSKSDSKTCML